MAGRAVVALAACLWLGWAAGALAQACREGEPSGRLVSGRGRVVLDGKLLPEPIRDVPVCAGQLLEVGTASRANLRFDDAQTIFNLDQNSQFRLRPKRAEQGWAVYLGQGAAHFLSRVRQSLTVETPYVNNGIDGTEVLVRLPAGRRAAEVAVFEGRVRLEPAAGFQVAVANLEAGQSVTVVPSGGPPDPPRPEATPADLARRLAWTLAYPELPLRTVLPGGGLARAQDLLRVGRVDEAAAILAGLQVGGAEGAERDALRAVIAIGQYRAADAGTLAAAALAADNASAAALVAQSYARQLAADIEGARDSAAAAAVAAPDSALAFARLAEVELMRGERRRSRRAADRAAELGDTALTHLVRGYALLAQQRPREAERAFNKALDRDPELPGAHLGRGLARIRQNRVTAGRESLELAVAHDPAGALYRSYLAKAYFTEHRDARSRRQLDLAKGLDPTDPTPWLYDALQLQLSNRPVEALGAIERSIDLNDGRATYRSRLLLDEDRAVREASLGRVYDDLGFTRLGQLEASRALTSDPSSASGHRLLADLYRGEPRLQSARVSELLQSQLLSPVGHNTIQPSLLFTDLNVVQDTGPGSPTFNEFTPLFVREGVRGTATVVGGNQSIWGSESVVSALQGPISLSLGQFHFSDQGFRPNNEIRNDVVTWLAEGELPIGLKLQGEYRRRRTDQGDRTRTLGIAGFDADRGRSVDYSPNLDSRVDQDVVRVGGRMHWAPGQDTVVSVFHADRDERDNDFVVDPSSRFDTRNRTADTGWLVEAQHLATIDGVRLVGGLAQLRNRERRERLGRLSDELGPLFEDESSEERTGTLRAAYGYAYVQAPTAVTWTLGMGLTQVDGDPVAFTTATPKLGVEWQVAPALRLRAGAFRAVQRPVSLDQTIEPTQVAGFNQVGDDLQFTRTDTVALGGEARLSPRWRVGLDWERRWASQAAEAPDGRTEEYNEDQRDHALTAFVDWTPTNRLALGLAPRLVLFRQSPQDAGNTPTSIDSYEAAVTARYFLPNGLFTASRLTLLRQDVGTASVEGAGRGGDENVALLDLTLGWRLPRQAGVLSLEARNLLDQKFDFQDQSFRTRERQDPRFFPERTVLAKLTIHF